MPRFSLLSAKEFFNCNCVFFIDSNCCLFRQKTAFFENKDKERKPKCIDLKELLFFQGGCFCWIKAKGMRINNFLL